MRIVTIGIAALAAAALTPMSGATASRSASSLCPVLYRGSLHTCYVYPTARVITLAQRQMPVRVVDPAGAVRRFSALPLTAVIVDRTRRDTGVLHPWVINYIFGQAPDLGVSTSTVSASARFLVISEAVGLITLLENGVRAYDTPHFERIRVNSRGRAIWTASVNLPHRNITLGIHSTLPQATLQRLITFLMQQTA